MATYGGEDRAEGTNKAESTRDLATGEGLAPFRAGGRWEEMPQKKLMVRMSTMEEFCCQVLYSPGREEATERNPVPKREGVGKKYSDHFFHPLISGACQSQLTREPGCAVCKAQPPGHKAGQ